MIYHHHARQGLAFDDFPSTVGDRDDQTCFDETTTRAPDMSVYTLLA